MPYTFNLPRFLRGELSVRTSFVCVWWGVTPLGFNIIAPMILGHRGEQATGISLRPLSYIVSVDSSGIECEDPGMQG